MVHHASRPTLVAGPAIQITVFGEIEQTSVLGILAFSGPAKMKSRGQRKRRRFAPENRASDYRVPFALSQPKFDNRQRVTTLFQKTTYDNHQQ